MGLELTKAQKLEIIEQIFQPDFAIMMPNTSPEWHRLWIVDPDGMVKAVEEVVEFAHALALDSIQGSEEP